jgi:hypothetical protein
MLIKIIVHILYILLLIDMDREVSTYKFNWQFYCQYYDDLRKAGIINELLAIKHYNQFGKKEGRFINPLQIQSRESKPPTSEKTPQESRESREYYTIIAVDGGITLVTQELVTYDLTLITSENKEKAMNHGKIIFKHKENFYCLFE